MLRFLIYSIIDFGIIEFFSLFLFLTNAFTFAVYAADKRKAVTGGRRIRERTLLFFTLAFGGVGAVSAMLTARHKIRKRKFIAVSAIGFIITMIPVIHIADGLTMGRIIRYKEIDFYSESWPAELDGYRIAFISDTHDISDESMRKTAAELNKRGLDLLLLGGDFTMRDGHYLGTLRELAQINAADGIFGVDGNHDSYTKLFAAMESYGMTPLDNGGTRVRDGFYLAGVQDAWNRSPDIQKAAADALPGDFVLLISHNPDLSMQQSTKGVGLILSGHTHAGQITFFGYPFYFLYDGVVITHYGTRFSYGFAESADGVPVYVTSGIGTFTHLPRIFARPEAAVITMYNGESPGDYP